MNTGTGFALSERFETAFNRIHKQLQQLVSHSGNDRFTFLIKEGEKKHAVIRKHADDLYQFARLRNAIVHEKINTNFYIAEPHETVVKQIEKIAMQLQQPQHALTIATAPVIYFYKDTPLTEVLSVIQKHPYTQFPIYNRRGEYKWVLTSNMVVNWIAHNLHHDVIYLEEIQVRDLYVPKKEQHIAFTSAFSSIIDAEFCFEEHHLQGKKLEALIITMNGEKNELPLGIITPWDLMQISKAH